MKPLTPTATAVLAALRDAPATSTALRARIGCSRSALDKALADLTRGGLATRLPNGHPDHPNHWTLTAADTPQTLLDTADPTDAVPDDDLDASAEGNDAPPVSEADRDPDASEGTTADEPEAPPVGDDTDHTDIATPDGATDGAALAEAPHDPPSVSLDEVDDTATKPAADPSENVQSEPAEDEVKLCRGCQAQMPRICPTCWTKTSSYCGACRRTIPARGRTAPEILSNGLPKLARGQLAELVHDVMRAHPTPAHLGVAGWTPGRIAVYLPGRSTGAISNALDKLTTTGAADLLADNPKRYRLHPNPDHPAPATQVSDTTPDLAQPVDAPAPVDDVEPLTTPADDDTATPLDSAPSVQ